MKYIKQYEKYINSNDKLPEYSKLRIGDYVLIDAKSFTPTHIYQITQAYEYKEEDKNSETRITYKLGDTDMWKYAKYLTFLSTDKDEAIAIVAANKYNL